MSASKVVNWWKTSRALVPNSNTDLNRLIVDLRADYAEMDPQDAAGAAVCKITKEHQPPYVLLASGGVDSQAMIHAWSRSGCEFKIVNYSYNGENSHDIDTLHEFCQRYHLPVYQKLFDVRRFISSSEYLKYAVKYDCASPQILTYIKMVENHLDETVIMAGNFFTPVNAGMNYTLLALDRYTQQTKSNFIPFFFQSTPELAYSFIKSHVENMNVHSSQRTKLDRGYAVKCSTYQDCGFPVIPQSEKFTGFEKIKESYDQCVVPSRLKLRYLGQPSKRPFDLLFRYSLYDHIGLKSEQCSFIFSDKIRPYTS